MTTAIQESIVQDVLIALCQEQGFDMLVQTYGQKELVKYLNYMNKVDLIQATVTPLLDGDYVFEDYEILPKGYAYIGQDDGIYEKLNTVTINFNEKTLKAILIANVSDSDMSENDKNTLIAHIKSLPKEALTTLSNRLVEEAFNTMPTLARFLFGLITASGN